MLPRSMKRFHFLLVLAGAVDGGTASAQDAKGQITFCSYNLKNYIKMERSVAGKRTDDVGKPEKEITAEVRFLSEIKPDVLGVCEIGTETELKDLQGRLKEA